MDKNRISQLAEKYDHLAASLTCAFIWKKSDEGLEYWLGQRDHLRYMATALREKARALAAKE